MRFAGGKVEEGEGGGKGGGEDEETVVVCRKWVKASLSERWLW
jgi:hypothetical protein